MRFIENIKTVALVSDIQELSRDELDAVDGAGPLAGAVDGLTAASIVAGGLACVPTPATPALVAFGVMTALMAVGANYIDRQIK